MDWTIWGLVQSHSWVRLSLLCQNGTDFGPLTGFGTRPKLSILLEIKGELLFAIETFAYTFPREGDQIRDRWLARRDCR